MAKIYYSNDAEPDLIKNKKVAVIGYGSQGHAHALNLSDSGVDVTVGLREGSKSWDKASDDGLKVNTVAGAAAWADTVMVLAPDTEQPALYEADVEPHLLQFLIEITHDLDDNTLFLVFWTYFASC